MFAQQDTERIVTRFKKNHHFLDQNTLGMVIQYIKQYEGDREPITLLIAEINEMSIMQASNLDRMMLKRAIDLLNLRNSKGESVGNYQTLVNDLFSWSILYISPYQSQKSKLFDERPDKSFFMFQPEDKVNMHMTRFKKIRDYNKQFYFGNEIFIGILFERLSVKGGKTQMVLQDEVVQMVIVFEKGYEPDCFLIPGCTYIVKGRYTETNMIISSITLPKPVPSKNSLLKEKFDEICRNINAVKDSLEFQSRDFAKYQAIYNEQHEVNKAVLVFGNITICKDSISRIYAILSTFQKGTECIIIMLSDQKHQEIDLSGWLSGHKVFLIPHVNSEGPRILPKIPVLKNNFRCKVLSNPAKLSIHGKQTIFVNYPLVKNLYSKNVVQKEITKINEEEMVQKVSDFLFSQNNVAISNELFWRQSEYLNINDDNLLFICDKACPLVHKNNSHGGGIVSTGNFQRDGDFLMYFPKFDQGIQFCQEPRDS